MNFKKIITLLLAFTLTLSLAACGSKGDGKGDGDAGRCKFIHDNPLKTLALKGSCFR